VEKSAGVQNFSWLSFAIWSKEFNPLTRTLPLPLGRPTGFMPQIDKAYESGKMPALPPGW
jgi:hypothetical protein